MLTTYRRHLKKCEHSGRHAEKDDGKGRSYRRCQCPIWVDGFLDGIEIRFSLKLRDWQKAQDKVREWEAENRIVEESAPKTVAQACDGFLEDARARNLQDATLEKYRLLFRRLQAFAGDQGITLLRQFDLEMWRKFRASWTLDNLAALKTLERLRAFSRFAAESDWMAENYVKKLKNPKITSPPTLPFSAEQVSEVLGACADYPDKLNRVRLRAMILLLRYSGLRIRDAVTLPRNRIQGDKLFLYTAKTGTPVFCPLPQAAVQALEAIPTVGQHFFWTGESKPKSAVGDWQRSLRRLFKLAGVPDGHAHRFRDTFAVELLLRGVPIERVSMLLGHKSASVTEKHYAPWIHARQQQLEQDVRSSWKTDLLVASAKGTREVRGKRPSVN